MADFSAATVVGIAGFLAGGVFGATVQRTHFCAMGAIADVALFGDWRRMRAWLLIIAVAILGSQSLQAAGLIDLGRSSYLGSELPWLGVIGGGLMFGFGMTLTGGCSSRNLVRLGAGNLKSLVVLLIMGLFATMTMSGVLGFLPRALAGVDLAVVGIEDQGLDRLLSAATGFSVRLWHGLLTVLVVGGLLIFCLKDRMFRSSRRDLSAGLILGLLIPLGWLITGVIGSDVVEPRSLESFAFVAPVGDALSYLTTFTHAAISFGVASVGGVVVGAFLAARAAGEFRIEAFIGVDDLVRHLSGAALMGTGGVLALGCTVGQGMTGLSTLALGSILAFLAIVVGGIAGVRYLERGSLKAAVRALVAGG